MGCGVELPPSRDYVTIAGFIMSRLGRLPQAGDGVEERGTRLTVLSMREHRVETVEVRVLDDEDDWEKGDGS